jgi:predicted transglutaminase-like cysteine proteinase
MKTSKQVPSDFSSSRRAQPLRQTRTNPPRSSISGARPFGPRGSISGGLEKEDIEIFPAITHFADVITALPKELVRHFTLLKEVDAKIFVDAALNAPLPQRPRAVEAHHTLGPTSTPMSVQNSLNGSIINGHVGSVDSAPDAVDVYNHASMAWDPANLARRQLFQHCAYTMQNMLVSLDEKNHVISTAAEALNKQLARIDDCFPYIEREVSDEAMYGSTTHWAYPENRTGKVTGSGSRRDIAAVNHIAAAAHAAEEIAARSDARKQAVAERKKGRTSLSNPILTTITKIEIRRRRFMGIARSESKRRPLWVLGSGSQTALERMAIPPRGGRSRKGQLVVQLWSDQWVLYSAVTGLRQKPRREVPEKLQDLKDRRRDREQLPRRMDRLGRGTSTNRD